MISSHQENLCQPPKLTRIGSDTILGAVHNCSLCDEQDLLSVKHIADVAITGVPMGTVMSRLARARKMFAEAWNGSQMRSPKEMLR